MKPYLLSLENFQSIRDRVEIPIKPLTFLYGPNSAGKSCVDDAFSVFSTLFSSPGIYPDSAMMRWAHSTTTKNNRNKPSESITKLGLHCQVKNFFGGNFDPIDSKGGLVDWFEKTGWKLVFGIEGSADEITEINLSAGEETVFRIGQDELSISLKAFGNTFVDLCNQFSVPIEENQIAHKINCSMDYRPTLSVSIYQGSDLDYAVVRIINGILEAIRDPTSMRDGIPLSPLNLGADRSTIKNEALITICSDYSTNRLPPTFVNQPRLLEIPIAVDSKFKFMAQIASSHYRTTFSEKNKLQNPGVDDELQSAIRASVWSHRVDEPENTEPLHLFVNRCLREHLFLDQGYQIVFEPLEIKPSAGIELPSLSAAVMVGSLFDKTGRQMTFEDVGTGISCVVPVLVAVHSGYSFIEQPELHLHPALQSALGDVFVEATKVPHAYHFVETHSEYILLRCLRRIRETTAGKHHIDSPLSLKPEDLSVVYFEPQPDGYTKVKSIRVSRQGDFMDRWPRGFFEERGMELFDE